MKLKPLGDLIIVEPAEAEAKIGSIVLAQSSQEEARHGKVLAVGPGKQMNGWVEPMDLKVGDTVLFSMYAKETIKIQGRQLITMHQTDVVGVLEN